MKTKTCIAIGLLICFSITAFAQVDALIIDRNQIFELDLDPGQLENIALRYGRMLLGDDVFMGRPLPLFNKHDRLVILAYPFSKYGPHFTEPGPLVEEVSRIFLRFPVRDEWLESGRLAHEHLRELKRIIGPVATVYISAVRNEPPVIGATKSLHPYFTKGILALKKAERVLEDDNVQLSRMVFLGPQHECFEFISESGSTLIHVNDMRIISKEELEEASDRLTQPDAKQVIDQWWKYVEETPPTGLGIKGLSDKTYSVKKELKYKDLVPVVDWTHWCHPTAVTMMVGYWDNYTRATGTIKGFGNLIKCWYVYNGQNIPDFLHEIIDPATGTWRPGYANLGDLIQKRLHYSFKYTETTCNLANDFGWNILKSEISNGRPLVWSTDVPLHSNTAIGYNETPFGKFVITYDTWGTTAADQYHEWNYALCTGLATLVPSSAPGPDHAVLDTPYGGESYNLKDAIPIKMYIWGTTINTVDVEFSSDGGVNWSTVAKNMSVKKGWNYYQWQPTTTTTKGRIRIRGYGGGILYSADGSHTNFRIEN